MFETLFNGRKTLETYRTAPLLDSRLRYLEHLAETGARPPTLRGIAMAQLRLVLALDLTGDDKVRLGQIQEVAEEWSCPGLHRKYERAGARFRGEFVSRTVRWLRFVGLFQEPEDAGHAHEAEVSAYEKWMRQERGFSEQSIGRYCKAANEFLDWLPPELPLASVRISDIDGAITAKQAARNYSRPTIRNYATGLKAFFRFAEQRGWTTHGLAEGIVAPQTYPNEGVPLGPTRDEVQRVLATTEGDRPTDKRDRALLMTLIAYGLRSGEVRGLRLDDLDWENERLRVRRPKSGRTDHYPLSPGVGEAILRYILEVRPRATGERTVFLLMRAPFTPLSAAALGTVVRTRFARAGVVLRRMGPHALRHAAAQRLLDQGMSLKVVGDFLGHRHPSTTGIYAKVDLPTLREVAEFDLGSLA